MGAVAAVVAVAGTAVAEAEAAVVAPVVADTRAVAAILAVAVAPVVVAMTAALAVVTVAGTEVEIGAVNPAVVVVTTGKVGLGWEVFSRRFCEQFQTGPAHARPVFLIGFSHTNGVAMVVLAANVGSFR